MITNKVVQLYTLRNEALASLNTALDHYRIAEHNNCPQSQEHSAKAIDEVNATILDIDTAITAAKEESDHLERLEDSLKKRNTEIVSLKQQLKAYSFCTADKPVINARHVAPSAGALLLSRAEIKENLNIARSVALTLGHSIGSQDVQGDGIHTPDPHDYEAMCEIITTAIIAAECLLDKRAA